MMDTLFPQENQLALIEKVKKIEELFSKGINEDTHPNVFSEEILKLFDLDKQIGCKYCDCWFTCSQREALEKVGCDHKEEVTEEYWDYILKK